MTVFKLKRKLYDVLDESKYIVYLNELTAKC